MVNAGKIESINPGDFSFLNPDFSCKKGLNNEESAFWLVNRQKYKKKVISFCNKNSYEIKMPLSTSISIIWAYKNQRYVLSFFCVFIEFNVGWFSLFIVFIVVIQSHLKHRSYLLWTLQTPWKLKNCMQVGTIFQTHALHFKISQYLHSYSSQSLDPLVDDGRPLLDSCLSLGVWKWREAPLIGWLNWHLSRRGNNH